MGIGGISIWQLLIVLLIVVLIFGTKRLKGMGSDLGGAMKGFKDAMNDDGKDAEAETEQKKTIDAAADSTQTSTETAKKQEKVD